MATIVIARPRTAPPILPLHAHTPNHVSNEPPVPLKDMSQLPEARYQQLPQAEDSPSDLGENPEVSEATLTPSSTEDHEQVQEAPGLRFAVLPWNRFFSNPFSRRPIADNSPNGDKESGYDKVRHEKLEGFELGIPRLGALLDSNESFSIFRRYGATAARILLHRELELGELVKELHKLDQTDAAPGGKVYRLSSVEHQKGWDREQVELIDKTEDKLLKYYDLLLRYTEVRALGQPPEHDQLSLSTWMKNHRPLVEEEASFICYIEDLVSAKKKIEANSQSGNGVEDMLDWLSSKRPQSFPQSFLNALFKSKSKEMKTDDPFIYHHSSGRVATSGKIVVVFLAVNFLLIPVFLLFLVQMSRAAMALTVMGFVLAFSVVLAAVAQARVQEILIGTAAYGAFLVTFLGNMNSGCALGTGSQ